MRFPPRTLRAGLLRRLRTPRFRAHKKIRILAAALLLIGILLLRLRWIPSVRTLAAMQVDNEISDLINDAVSAYLAGTSLSYEDLVHLDRDAEGSVSAVQLNMPQANRMRSEIIQQLSLRIPNLATQKRGIPVGNVLRPSRLSGRGGMLPVRVVSLQNVNAEFSGEFSQAGINQTLHRLDLTVSVELILLTPAGQQALKVCTSVPVAQTVIVGGVPNILMTGG